MDQIILFASFNICNFLEIQQIAGVVGWTDLTIPLNMEGDKEEENGHVEYTALLMPQ